MIHGQEKVKYLYFIKLSFVAERDLYNGGFTVCSVSQRFSLILREDCEQRGLSVEVFDLASIEPEERLVEEVCIVRVSGCS
jgi:uncharacterized membrane protein